MEVYFMELPEYIYIIDSIIVNIQSIWKIPAPKRRPNVLMFLLYCKTL